MADVLENIIINVTEASAEEVTITVNESLQGLKGDAFVYEDFTPEQLEALKGLPGYTPTKGVDYFDGDNAREVEFQKTATHIQWRYVGGSWNNLVALADIKGADGYTPVKGVDYNDGLPGTTDFNALNNKPDSLSDINSTEGNKLSGIEAGANNYAHPANHAPSVITQDADNRFVTDAEKSTWNAKQSAGAYLVGADVVSKADISLAVALAVAL